MAEHEDTKMNNEEQSAPAANSKAFAARRRFLRQALAASSGVALAQLLPLSFSEGSTQAVQCPAGQPFIPLTPEIRSNGNKLQAVLRIVNANRVVPTSVAGTQNTMLRFYSGYNPVDTSQAWPPPGRTAPGPGPTFRCQVGDQVQITFLNQINVSAYPASTFNGENGSGTGCDEATTGTDPDWYPQTTGDLFPNCFHASSAANVHFHGLHVSPSTTGDNVLVNIWPDPKLDANAVQNMFKQFFAQGVQPQKWSELPQAFRDQQLGPEAQWPTGPKGLVGTYDATAPYNGGRGLPPQLQLWPVDYKEVKTGVWPQYYVGAYPYLFDIPRYQGPTSGVKMGQAPGTHWYHSHKHGSTSINMFNGLSGAFIIEDNGTSNSAYDGVLNRYYQSRGTRLEQVVMVLQQITGVTNLLTTGTNAGAAPVLVNGQFTPVLKMTAGQIQLWRVVNACVQRAVTFQFSSCNTGDPAPVFKQTAQDGVQLAPVNYASSGSPINVAPANRVDALVQAPAKAGRYILGTPTAPIAYIDVAGTSPRMTFPAQNEFPVMPDYLSNITDSEISGNRLIVYGWDTGRTGAGRSATGQAPYYTINGRQFMNGVVNETMKLGTAEEWQIVNLTTVPHPFHIHVNPFQIVELYNPNTMQKPLRIVANAADLAAAQAKWGTTKDYTDPTKVQPTWWDNFAIPIALTASGKLVLGTSGYAQTPGYFTMRSRFVDFTGLYVQHCHILAHEDRGMMQLLQVCQDPSSLDCKRQGATVKHH